MCERFIFGGNTTEALPSTAYGYCDSNIARSSLLYSNQIATMIELNASSKISITGICQLSYTTSILGFDDGKSSILTSALLIHEYFTCEAL